MGTVAVMEKPVAEPQMSERVTQIMEAAAQIFASKGYKGTSMRDIADACDISKALLYHHFESKDQIYRLVATEASKRLYSHVEASVARETMPSAKLRAFMIATAEHFHHHRWAWIASTNAFWSDPDRRNQEARILRRDRYEQQLRGILQEAIEVGEVRPDVDVAMAGRLVLSALNWMHRWYDPAKTLTPPQIADQYFGMIFEGLRRRD